MFGKFNFNLNINGLKEAVTGSTKIVVDNTKSATSNTYAKVYKVVLKAINLIFCSKEEVNTLELEEVEARIKTLKRVETIIKDLSGLSTVFGIINLPNIKAKKKIPTVSGPLTSVVINSINIYTTGRKDASMLVALSTPLVLKKIRSNINILNARRKELINNKKKRSAQPKVRRVKDFSFMLDNGHSGL